MTGIVSMQQVFVALPVPVFHPFTYHTDEPVLPGCRVRVRLAGRTLVGVVLPGTPQYGQKTLPVLEIIDPLPVFTLPTLQALIWAAGYYHHPIGEVLRSAHPMLDDFRLQRRFRACPAEANPYLGTMDPWSGELAHIRPGNTYDRKTFRRAGKTDAWIEKACQLGWLVPEEEENRRRVGAVSAVVEAAAPGPEEMAALRRRPVRYRILCDLVEAHLPVPVADILREHPTARAHLAALQKEGWVRIEKIVPDASGTKDPFEAQLADGSPSVELTAEQRDAVDAVLRQSGVFSPFLLEGVTGSGKTEVYLRIIESELQAGRGAVVIVPEIALTPQLASRFSARFPGQVAVLHSALPAALRARAWRSLATGERRIALGARSAVFAPVRGVGVIVVDEEHDASFKQEDGFLYNARDFALVRGREENCPVVMGSATPSMESRLAIQKGRFVHLRLTRRPVARPMPAVACIDLRVHATRAMLSGPLLAALQENLDAGQQSILFLNRRGSFGMLQCASCGQTRECPRCAVSMTVHLRQASLVCHYCGMRIPLPARCECGGTFIQEREGVEQVFNALQDQFPAARIARLDRDATRFAGLSRLLADMRAGAVDILVGTQMVVKGHDFPGVTLVGVLDADQGLFFQDFRAAERTFQLLVQVAGRAGRGSSPGRVLIQTRRPEHHAIHFAANQDVEGFARRELLVRRELSYPPFGHVVLFRIQGENETALQQQAEAFAGFLRAQAGGVEVLGPAPAPLARIRGTYRYQVLLKSTDRRILHERVRQAASFVWTAGVKARPDVDPQHML